MLTTEKKKYFKSIMQKKIFYYIFVLGISHCGFWSNSHAIMEFRSARSLRAGNHQFLASFGIIRTCTHFLRRFPW